MGKLGKQEQAKPKLLACSRNAQLVASPRHAFASATMAIWACPPWYERIPAENMCQPSSGVISGGGSCDKEHQSFVAAAARPLSPMISPESSPSTDACRPTSSSSSSSKHQRHSHHHHHHHHNHHAHNAPSSSAYTSPWLMFVFFGFVTLLAQPYVLGDGAAASPGDTSSTGPSSLGGDGISGLFLFGLANNRRDRDSPSASDGINMSINKKEGDAAAKIKRWFGVVDKDGKTTHTVEGSNVNDDEATNNSIERGKPISSRVRGEELYEAYRQIREEYKLKAMSAEYAKKWDILKATSDGIQIAMLQHPSDPNCPYVRMTGIMPGDIGDVWEFLELDNWEETMPKMDPFYAGLTILGKYSHRPNPARQPVSMVLAKKKTKRILMYGKRDFTFVSVSDVPRSDGVWVSGTVSVTTPKFPREKGYVRAFQDSVGFYKALPNDSETGEPRTLLTIVCRIDLNDSAEGGSGGNIPMFFYVKTIGSSGVLSMKNMRAELRTRLGATLAAAREMKALEGRKRVLDERACPLIPWVGLVPSKNRV